MNIAKFRFCLVLSLLLAIISFSASRAVCADAPKPSEVGRTSLRINGAPFFMFSGALHYFRVPEPLWADRLAKMRQAGLNTVETYIAWNWHEPERDKPDYGQLDRFITLTQKMGFYLIVRPGPYICAEWDVGGYPEWVLASGAVLRTDEPRHLKAVQHYYDTLLPVLRPHLITNGGNIILYQIENEYDFAGPEISPRTRKKYIDFLYDRSLAGGINVPIFTCWTREMRNENDPFGKKVVDTSNFYPRGNFDGVMSALRMLSLQQPNNPLWVSELEGGWFSETGGPAPDDMTRVDAPEINSLTKLVISQGVTGLNYYMFFGGTNFGYWGSKNKTTTYDYKAPLAETGGLHDKYFEVKAIGDFLRLWGPKLAIAHAAGHLLSVKDGEANAKDVISDMRETTDGERFIYLANRSQDTKYLHAILKSSNGELTFPSRSTIHVLSMGAKLLPANVSLADGVKLIYTTAEMSGIYKSYGRTYVVLYDYEGANGELRLAVPDTDAAVGIGSSYVVRDTSKKEIIIGFCHEESDKIITIGNNLALVIVERNRGLRTWWTGSKTDRIPLVSDAYFMRNSNIKRTGAVTKISADLELQPGPASFSIPAIGAKVSVRADGRNLIVDPGAIAAFTLHTPQPDISKVSFDITSTRVMADPLDASAAAKSFDKFRPLNKDGFMDRGHYIYEAEIPALDQGAQLFIQQYYDDPFMVFVDGRLLSPVKSEGMASMTFDLPARNRTSKLMILFEDACRTNGGAIMSTAKGIARIRLQFADGKTENIETFRITQGLGGERRKWFAPSFDDKSWKLLPLGDWKDRIPALQLHDGVVWYRASFALPETPGWSLPLGLRIGASDYALIWVNGKLLGRYWQKGPQTLFYLPENWLNRGPKGRNVIAIAVRNSGGPGGLYKLGVEPYSEFAAKKTHLEITLSK